jgi:hypothetical protein
VLAPGDLIVAVKLLQHVGAGVELVEREHVARFERLDECVQAAGCRLNARSGHRAGRVDAEQRHDVDGLLHGADDDRMRIGTRGVFVVALETVAARRLRKGGKIG